MVATDEYCKAFFNSRITMFAFSLIENIPFNNFLKHVLTAFRNLQFGDLSEIIKSLFNDCSSELLITNNAKNAIVKVNTD